MCPSRNIPVAITFRDSRCVPTRTTPASTLDPVLVAARTVGMPTGRGQAAYGWIDERSASPAAWIDARSASPVACVSNASPASSRSTLLLNSSSSGTPRASVSTSWPRRSTRPANSWPGRSESRGPYPVVDVDIRAADAVELDAHQDVARTDRRNVDLPNAESTRFLEHYRLRFRDISVVPSAVLVRPFRSRALPREFTRVGIGSDSARASGVPGGSPAVRPVERVTGRCIRRR